MTTNYNFEKFFDPSAVSTGFEGPEKRLEVDFKRTPLSAAEESNAAVLGGLRGIPQGTWQDMLDYAKCTIISHTQNEFFDSYVLSESSLFVYPHKIMVKTCGTTTLLSVIPKLLEIAQTCDLSVEFVMFSRKNYLFPQMQKDPHNRWEDEVSYMNSIFDGSAYVIGPTSGDHWYLYLADYSDNTRIIEPEKTLEIMMHNLDPQVANQFYRKSDTSDKDKFPGISDLIEDSITDEFNFTPCGYSMNGLSKESYYTIHVTPELICSYASFETNISLNSYSKLINHVLSIFKPGTFTITFFSEKSNTQLLNSVPFESNELEGYVLKHRNFSELEGNCDVLMMNYESADFATKPRQPKKIKMSVSMIEPMTY